MFKMLFLIILTFEINNIQAETIKRDNASDLIVEWTPQIMLRGVEDLGCVTIVTVIIESNLRGRTYQIYDRYVYKRLCLDKQLEHEMENSK